MNRMLDALVLGKLALARHVLGRAIAAAAEPGILGPAVGVSLSQDALELILITIAEQKQVALPARATFEQVIAEIGKGATPIPHAIRLNQLNKARVGFKHHGITPDSELAKKLVSFAAVAADEICGQHLGVSLWSVAATQLVSRVRVRNHLDEALQLKEAGAFGDSVASSAKAFALTFGGVTNARMRRSSQGVARDVRDIASRGLDRDALREVSTAISALARSVERELELIYEEIETLQAQLHSVKVGIDLDRLARFEALVPTVRLTRAGTIHATWVTDHNRCSLEDADFAFEFAFDAIVRAQKPPSGANSGSTQEILILNATPVIVYPTEKLPEVVRTAQTGERLIRPARPEDKPGVFEILFEGERFYVSSAHARLVECQMATDAVEGQS